MAAAHFTVLGPPVKDGTFAVRDSKEGERLAVWKAELLQRKGSRCLLSALLPPTVSPSDPPQCQRDHLGPLFNP